jgi:hypothetical protein
VQVKDFCLNDKREMKKIISLLVVLVLFFSCKEEVVKKPDHLIEKGTMMDIIYDLSLLEAMKYNSPSSLENDKINPKEYIYKKYKIDSAQFSQNNIYYAANYGVYKDMFDQVTKRIDSRKIIVDSLVTVERKQDSLLQVKKKNLVRKDSLKLVKKKMDSIKGVKKKLLFKKDSLKLIKKKLSKKDSLSLVELKDLLKKDSLSRIKKKIIPVKKSPVRRDLK